LVHHVTGKWQAVVFDAWGVGVNAVVENAFFACTASERMAARPPVAEYGGCDI
jgi:hypothetical protein